MNKLLRFSLYPFSYIFRIIIAIRNILFDKKILTSSRLPVKIISVGNLTVGGSGKTPAVIYIAETLKKLNIQPAFLSRGYGRNTKGYKLVSDGNNILLSPSEAGDEIILAAAETGCPAAVSENRVIGAENLLKEVKADVIILDDAFQHRWINRDLNILIFDQSFLLGKNSIDFSLLPSGFMREPFGNIKRADICIINSKFSEKQPLPKRFLKHFNGIPLFYANYKALGFFDLKNQQFYKLSDFSGQKSLVVCGIARPESFLYKLTKNNIDITNKLIFKDHNNYDSSEIELIRKQFYETNSYSVLTTQKDAVKLSNFIKEMDDIDIYYLKIALHLDDEKYFNELLMKSIK